MNAYCTVVCLFIMALSKSIPSSAEQSNKPQSPPVRYVVLSQRRLTGAEIKRIGHAYGVVRAVRMRLVNEGDWYVWETGQVFPDLRTIARVAPKGRIQDKGYNPSIKAVDDLIGMGVEAVPFLIQNLDDDKKI